LYQIRLEPITTIGPLQVIINPQMVREDVGVHRWIAKFAILDSITNNARQVTSYGKWAAAITWMRKKCYNFDKKGDYCGIPGHADYLRK
jgi:hypothetical protein